VIRVLIVDDSTTIRAMLEEVLARENDIVLVGSAADAATALRLVREHRPDVATLDIAMPGTDGLALLDEIRGRTHAIMLTSRGEAVAESFDRGAFGFFEKSSILTESKRLLRMVRAAAAGRLTKHAA
jgi:DNA-binding NarL/FixJ family response regulator